MFPPRPARKRQRRWGEGFFDPDISTLNRVVTDGSFTYTPDRGFAGFTRFSYATLDELGRTSMASVVIDGSDSLPLALDDVFSVLSGGTLRLVGRKPQTLARHTGSGR